MTKLSIIRKIKATVFALAIIALPAFSQSEKELYIYHTNDTHSRIEPFGSEYQDTLMAGKAGTVRRATFMKQQRKEHKDLLMLDAGDFSQGTPYYNMYKGEVEVKMMNAIGYDAATIGNHEFDFGLDNMARLFKMANFPIVCSNYDVTGTVLEGLVKDYIVLKKNGVKVGIFGLGAQLEGLVATHCYGNVKFKDPVSEAQRVANFLRNNEHCDVIICLSHLGCRTDSHYSDIELIKNTNNIDVVIGGHSHTYFTEPKFIKNLDGEEVPMQQMGKNGAFVGKIILKLTKN